MNIGGIIAAMATPMHEDGTINEAELRNQVNRQINAGMNGIFCLGTNGEAYILSKEEKIRVMEIFVEEARGRVPVYAGTGCVGTKDTIELSQKAQEIGVSTLSIISPYFAAINQTEIYEHYAAIAKSVDLPIVMYNMPARTGNNIDYTTASKLAENFKNVAGIKDSSGNFDNILRYIESTDKETFSVLSGNDSLILWTLMAGGKGGITGVANILPDIMVSIYKHWNEGDFEKAKEAQDSIRPIRDCFKYGNPNSIVKRAANLIGQPLGPCRKPFGMVSKDADEAIINTIKKYYSQYANI
ncbi:4-hydroxy-tetrahydrodipicolinate synthase [Clostridium pascui]|uniref:4-hydroxy-tetrahydrodipicolinate synthase n=1 Tax=Clostridium pascui TaxID=46609 RepID=UPI00195C859E|nr:4-hydroxy-tetrahydrodipicolinate synthase [Clostridium pascui]MBM7871409.1 4-hydroxy-tetrahydrodipicolinate synthase [Clostridium pascui]